MDTPDFKFIFLGQSVLRYKVPLDMYKIINHIYETKYSTLSQANGHLINFGRSLFFEGEDSDKIKQHNLLPDNVIQWFEEKFKHYLDWNGIKKYKLNLNMIWVNQMLKHEYTPIHIHQGMLLTGLSSVMILKLPELLDNNQNGKLQILGAANGQFAKIDYQPKLKERDFYVFPYDMRHGVYPFNGSGIRRSLSANMDVEYDPIKNR